MTNNTTNTIVSVHQSGGTWKTWPDIQAEFRHGYFTLEFDGPADVFLNKFKEFLEHFIDNVTTDYTTVFHPDPEIRQTECFNEMYADMTVVDYPERFRNKKDSRNYRWDVFL